jgi:hypothetical protein
MADDALSDFVLMRDLSRDEQRLLGVIWDAAFPSVGVGERPGWQTWDYVWRSFAHAFPDSADPDIILAGLPSVARPGQPNYRYGLVWELQQQRPSPNGRLVGLSIGGMLRLSETRAAVLSFADGLAHLMAAIASAEIGLEPVRDDVAQGRRQISELIMLDAYTIPRLREPMVMTALAIGQVAQREYMPATINPTDEGGTVTLGWIRSRSFATIQDAKSYVTQIADETQRQRDAAAITPSPFPLAPTLDYLSLVLDRQPGWDAKTPLVDSPDLQSVLCLGQTAASVEEFERFLVLLWNLIGRLRVPEVPAKDLDPSRPKPGTLDRLQYWLNTNLGEPLPNAVAAALRQIRDVGKLREGIAHNAAGTQAAAAAAAARMGIPTPITSGELAWDTVQARLADAFNTIREAIRPPGNA